MQFEIAQDLHVIAELIGAKLIGNTDQLAYGLNEIHKVRPGDITFVDVEKYYNKSLNSAASIIIINKEVECPEGKALLVCDEPFTAFNIIAKEEQFYFPMNAKFQPDIKLGKNSMVEYGCVVGENVEIGANTMIHANVVIYPYTIIGDNVTIHANTTIGAEAFYFKTRADKYEKLQTCGRVIIQDNVEIGAGCTIDRGVSGDTIIGQGTKIDNQVHIGHGVEMGEMCLIAAQVGIAGKTIIGDHVKIWGQVGIKADVHIGDGAVVYAGSGVSRSLEAGKVYFGAPAVEMTQWKKEYMALQRVIREKINE